MSPKIQDYSKLVFENEPMIMDMKLPGRAISRKLIIYGTRNDHDSIDALGPIIRYMITMTEEMLLTQMLLLCASLLQGTVHLI